MKFALTFLATYFVLGKLVYAQDCPEGKLKNSDGQCEKEYRLDEVVLKSFVRKPMIELFVGDEKAKFQCDEKFDPYSDQSIEDQEEEWCECMKNYGVLCKGKKLETFRSLGFYRIGTGVLLRGENFNLAASTSYVEVGFDSKEATSGTLKVEIGKEYLEAGFTFGAGGLDLGTDLTEVVLRPVYVSFGIGVRDYLEENGGKFEKLNFNLGAGLDVSHCFSDYKRTKKFSLCLLAQLYAEIGLSFSAGAKLGVALKKGLGKDVDREGKLRHDSVLSVGVGGSVDIHAPLYSELNAYVRPVFLEITLNR